MNQKTVDLLKRLTEAPGAPGFENQVRDLIREEIKDYSDEIIYDNLGSIFGVKRGNPDGPKVMVAGHMDEVGFILTRVTQKGFLRFQPLGGWWNQVLLAQRVHIVTANGLIEGVIGSMPPHNLSPEQRNKPMGLEQMFIDVGADDADDVKGMGIRPGQSVVPICPFTPMANPNKIMAKAWDNRYGCALAVQLLQELEGVDLPNRLYSGAHVQEEVGLRGARTSAHLIQPDIFFALDAGPANDTPGSSEGFGELGKGALLRIFDRSMITHVGLRELILDTAESEGIPYQFFVSQGGTDAGEVHLSGNGVPSAVIGLCSRYIHSHASIAHIADYEAAKQLLISLVKKLDQSTVDTLRTYY